MEIQARAVIVVVEADHPRIRHQAVGAGAIKQGFKEQNLQLATINLRLQPIVTSPNTPRLGLDLQPFARVKTVIPGLHTDLRQRRPQAQAVRLAHRVGLKIDPDTQRFNRRYAFINPKQQPDLMQGQAQGKGQPTRRRRSE